MVVASIGPVGLAGCLAGGDELATPATCPETSGAGAHPISRHALIFAGFPREYLENESDYC